MKKCWIVELYLYIFTHFHMWTLDIFLNFERCYVIAFWGTASYCCQTLTSNQTALHFHIHSHFCVNCTVLTCDLLCFTASLTLKLTKSIRLFTHFENINLGGIAECMKALVMCSQGKPLSLRAIALWGVKHKGNSMCSIYNNSV